MTRESSAFIGVSPDLSHTILWLAHSLEILRKVEMGSSLQLLTLLLAIGKLMEQALNCRPRVSPDRLSIAVNIWYNFDKAKMSTNSNKMPFGICGDCWNCQINRSVTLTKVRINNTVSPGYRVHGYKVIFDISFPCERVNFFTIPNNVMMSFSLLGQFYGPYFCGLLYCVSLLPTPPILPSVRRLLNPEFMHFEAR